MGQDWCPALIHEKMHLDDIENESVMVDDAQLYHMGLNCEVVGRDGKNIWLNDAYVLQNTCPQGVVCKSVS